MAKNVVISQMALKNAHFERRRTRSMNYTNATAQYVHICSGKAGEDVFSLSQCVC